MHVENFIKTYCHIRVIDILSTKAICHLKTFKHFEVYTQPKMCQKYINLFMILINVLRLIITLEFIFWVILLSF
jgi:hypothetical protein